MRWRDEAPVPGAGRARRAMPAAIIIAALLISACGADPSASEMPSATEAPSRPESEVTSPPSGPADDDGVATADLFDPSLVHEVSIEFDEVAYESMIETYRSTGEKEWIEATVTVDGQTYARVGIRLKGNSSLRGLAAGPGGSSVSADDPASLPWLIDLDQFVDGQRHGDVVEFVVRSNNSETALSEAVALALLEQVGLASQDAVAVRFRANGGDEALRLVIENPDDAWMADAFDASGALYKAESGGDYSYRGGDPDAYDEIFDQEAGRDNADLVPLIEFLDFINNASDEEFAAEIAQRLDVDAFATYLAMQELLDNFDDIDGPGSNSYLYYDPASGQFTIVPWDYNLAFGTGPGGGLGGGAGGGGGSGGGLGPGIGAPGGNVLVDRFLAVDTYEALVADRLDQLRAELFDGGTASAILGDWVAVLEAGASDLVDEATLRAEADRIAAYF